MAANRYLKRRPFIAYLEEHGDQVVGSTRTMRECPVSLYLEDATKRVWHASPLACVPAVDAEVEEHEFKTPVWAQRFIHALDRHFGTTPVPVTGAQALYVLSEVS